jgi:site-specific recombinase XerD
MTEIQAIDPNERIMQMVLDAVTSEHTKREYARALRDFKKWREAQGLPFNKATVQRYAAELLELGASPGSVNVRLSAIRTLAREALDNGILPADVAAGIAKVKGVKRQGLRVGNWLTKHQAERLIEAPDAGTLKGKRDRALLGVLIGCGLRRAEAARLEFSHIQQREGRWVIVDLIGKGLRVRTVPIPAWCKALIDTWADAAGLHSGRVFRAVDKADKLNTFTSTEGITEQAIFYVVQEYADKVGISAAPHDLRRTFAKLAHQGGASLEQIQLSLGHGSVQTTERYLGVEQDLTDAPADHLGLHIHVK